VGTGPALLSGLPDRPAGRPVTSGTARTRLGPAAGTGANLRR